MKKQRLQVDLTPEQMAELDEMQVERRAVSKAQVVRDAFRVLRWLTRQLDEGWELRLVRNGKAKAVELL